MKLLQKKSQHRVGISKFMKLGHYFLYKMNTAGIKK